MDVITSATSSDIATGAWTIAVLPVGSFEQHGEHLPLATDTLIACGIAEAISSAHNLFLLPPITMSCSHEHAGWPGTVSISSATLHMLINDVVRSLHASGIDQLVLVNGHGGNYVLSNVVQELNSGGPSVALFPGRDDWVKARIDGGLVTDGHQDMHAGELEVSLLLHLMPHVVRDTYTQSDHDTGDRRKHLLTLGMRGYTSSGVIGRPSLGDAGKGKLVIDSLLASFQEYLRILS